jgi:lipid-A-disaccharide synthase
MPGSRRQEVGPILRRQLRVARALAERHGHCSFVLALADESHCAWAAPALGESGLAVRTVVGKTHEVQSAADLALAKSGTTTLELAFYGTPMIVFYNISPTQWHLAGRWMVTTPFLSLPNAVAGREIVKEFMYTGASESAMIEEASALLTDERRRLQMKADLADVRRRIDLPGTSDRAAREVLALVGHQAPPPPWYRWGFNL